MEEHKSDEEPNSYESSEVTSEGQEESYTLDMGQILDHVSETSSLSSKCKNNKISGESGIDDAAVNMIPASLICIEETKDYTSDNSNTPSRFSDEFEVSEETDRTSVKPMFEFMEDKNVGIDEIVVKNSTKLNSAAELVPDVGHTRSKSSTKHTNSSTQSASPTDSQTEYKVHEYEDSSPSMDITTTLASLEIADAEKTPRLKITLIESPPKRKPASRGLNDPGCSRSFSKNQTTDTGSASITSKELQDKPEYTAGQSHSIQEDGSENRSEAIIDLKIKAPTVESPEVERGSKSRRVLFKRIAPKRSHAKSSGVVKDISDKPSDPKRNKGTEQP